MLYNKDIQRTKNIRKAGKVGKVPRVGDKSPCRLSPSALPGGRHAAAGRRAENRVVALAPYFSRYRHDSNRRPTVACSLQSEPLTL